MVSMLMKNSARLIGHDLPLMEKVVRDLEGLGYAVQKTEHDESSGGAPAPESYDVVIADLNDGRCLTELGEALKKSRPETKILLITGEIRGQRSLVLLKPEAFDDSLSGPHPTDIVRFLAGNGRGRRLFEAPQSLEGIIHTSPEMKKTLKQALLVAPTDTVVLIQGESGTGKELVARAIHHNSLVRSGPFVPVNCGAIPETLLENELFGHKRGSYTGAQENRRGLFEFANGGTLFLDEISETSPALQVKLLRAIDSSEIRRVGDTYPVKVSCRILLAANKNIFELVRQGRFREDLYYRINSFPIYIPPLRARTSDIPLLVEYFLHKAAAHLDRPMPVISAEAAGALKARRWTGNVRELRHYVERLVLTCSGACIKVSDLPEENGEKMRSDKTASARLEEIEKIHILKIMEECGGKSGEAARILGISRASLGRKLKEYGLKSSSPCQSASASSPGAAECCD